MLSLENMEGKIKITHISTLMPDINVTIQGTTLVLARRSLSPPKDTV